MNMRRCSNKFKVLLFLFSLPLVSLTSCSCSNNRNCIFEIENSEMVTFPIDFYTRAMSSRNGLPITLKFEDAVFECTIEKGSFSFYDEIKKITIKSNNTIYYCPTYKNGENAVTDKEDTFVDVIVNVDNSCIGYSVIKINYDNSNSCWSSQLLVSSVFIDENNNVTNVSSDYVEQRIVWHHNNYLV